jgi:N-acetylmuramoyl-L-alanine amidase
MAGKYNIPLTLDQGRAGTKGIKSHRWVSQHIWGDHQDPYEYLARFGVTKQELVDDLAG